MMNVYYVPGNMSHFKQFLADVLHIGGVVEVFKDHSVGPLFLKLMCVEKYPIFFEVLDNVAVCVWSRAS
jgi:hypothetical protein